MSSDPRGQETSFRPAATLRETVAKWLQATYSRWPGGRGAWDELSEKSKAKWRREAGDLLGLLGEDPDARR